MKGEVNHPQNNRDRNQGVLYLCSKFGIITWTGDDLRRGQARGWHTRRDRRRQRQYPKAKTGLG